MAVATQTMVVISDQYVDVMTYFHHCYYYTTIQLPGIIIDIPIPIPTHLPSIIIACVFHT